MLIILSVSISSALPQGATIHPTKAIFTNLQNPAPSELQAKPISQEPYAVLGQQQQANPASQTTGSLNLSFDHYIIKYYSYPSINAQIVCYSGSTKVGEINFYGSEGIGGEVNQVFKNQFYMYLSISEFSDILNMLKYTRGPLNFQILNVPFTNYSAIWIESGEMQQVGTA